MNLMGVMINFLNISVALIARTTFALPLIVFQTTARHLNTILLIPIVTPVIFYTTRVMFFNFQARLLSMMYS